MKPLSKSFFKKSTNEVAKNLLSCYLVSKSKEGTTIGKIIETESYLYNDPASHSFNGKTIRNEAMFGLPGRAYIYFTYGMYFCFNVTTNKKGIGEAVLIRALEPIKGINLMKKRRNTDNLHQLCSGPAKLVIALGIKKEDYGLDLTKENSRVKIFSQIKEKKFEIIETKRIGISKGKELPHRFYIKGSKFISRK